MAAGSNEGAGNPAGNSPAARPASERTRVPMHVHTEGYSFANILYSVQGYALPRPQRLLPLIVSIVVGLVVAIRVVAPVLGGLAGLVAFGAIAWYLPRLVEELEEECGRNPLVELAYRARHVLNGRRNYFVGSRRATGPERRRLVAHFAAERELAGVAGYQGGTGRAVSSWSQLAKTTLRFVARTAHPTGRKNKNERSFDPRTDTTGDSKDFLPEDAWAGATSTGGSDGPGGSQQDGRSVGPE